MNIVKDWFVIALAFAHQFGCLVVDVEILLPTSLFLLEDYSGVVALLVNLTPRQFDNIATSQTSKAREQKSPLYIRVFAFSLHKRFDLFQREVHSGSLFRLETLDTQHRVSAYYAFLKRLVQASS